MKPEEYLTYFEDFISIADKESGKKNMQVRLSSNSLDSEQFNKMLFFLT